MAGDHCGSITKFLATTLREILLCFQLRWRWVSGGYACLRIRFYIPQTQKWLIIIWKPSKKCFKSIAVMPNLFLDFHIFVLGQTTQERIYCYVQKRDSFPTFGVNPVLLLTQKRATSGRAISLNRRNYHRGNIPRKQNARTWRVKTKSNWIR